MKTVLPKLAQPRYYQQLKSGRARGGEAVMLVENIRSYYDILLRNAEPFAPTPSVAEGLKRLVIEIEERRKGYSRRIAAAKSISATEKNSTGENLRLPTIGQEINPAEKD
jgi:membrane-bound lytic murein transglycosylase F